LGWLGCLLLGCTLEGLEYFDLSWFICLETEIYFESALREALRGEPWFECALEFLSLMVLFEIIEALRVCAPAYVLAMEKAC
jgi:hypothetical protein